MEKGSTPQAHLGFFKMAFSGSFGVGVPILSKWESPNLRWPKRKLRPRFLMSLAWLSLTGVALPLTHTHLTTTGAFFKVAEDGSCCQPDRYSVSSRTFCYKNVHPTQASF